MKELTPRQIRERAAYEAEKASAAPKRNNNGASERRDYLRKQAGWPALRGA